MLNYVSKSTCIESLAKTINSKLIHFMDNLIPSSNDNYVFAAHMFVGSW